MFEFEIMLTGYSIVIVSASVAIGKICFNKKLNELQQSIQELHSESNRLKLEVSSLIQMNTK